MRRAWRKIVTAVILTLFSTCASAQTVAESFANLHRLVGEWAAKTPSGAVIRVSYRAISRDSALVETFRTASGDETLTIYHPDGADLVATHYCAQGNQPRLRLQPGGTKSTFEFTYWDATNLPAPSASHLTRLRFDLRDPNHFEKTEIYTENGKEDVTVFKFSRVEKR